MSVIKHTTRNIFSSIRFLLVISYLIINRLQVISGSQFQIDTAVKQSATSRGARQLIDYVEAVSWAPLSKFTLLQSLRSVSWDYRMENEEGILNVEGPAQMPLSS